MLESLTQLAQCIRQHEHMTDACDIFLQADSQDIEKATQLAFKYALESPELLKGSDSRAAFKSFLEVVAQAHPIER